MQQARHPSLRLTNRSANTVKVYLALTILAFALVGCSATTVGADVPKGETATIEGLSMTEVVLSPVVKLNWPDLTSFDIDQVDSTNVARFSDSKVIVSAGRHTIQVSAGSIFHGVADHLPLSAETKAGHVYLVRPVYHHYSVGDQIDIVMVDRETKEVVAQTW